MSRRVGTWWIKDGLDSRRKEAQGFGEVLDNLSSFDWTQDHGDSAVKKKDFVETANYIEKVDQVDIMFMSTHGVYDPDDSSTWGKGFATDSGTVRSSHNIDWGKGDLEYFSTHACRLLYHSAGNSVGRWASAFKRLHYMFGFHTPSYSGGAQEDRGKKWAMYAAFHHWIPFIKFNLRTAWRLANEETEGSGVQWAYLRANGATTGGTAVNTYNATLNSSEPSDPSQNKTFWTARGTC